MLAHLICLKVVVDETIKFIFCVFIVCKFLRIGLSMALFKIVAYPFNQCNYSFMLCLSSTLHMYSPIVNLYLFVLATIFSLACSS